MVNDICLLAYITSYVWISGNYFCSRFVVVALLFSALSLAYQCIVTSAFNHLRLQNPRLAFAPVCCFNIDGLFMLNQLARLA